ncbi:MAG: hypothetical protein JWQ81_7391 [Amycolatopsis sp.]|jgi:hypothetical protein|uniref:hypothetical protein n=1 Tax=Amycolatopsis sp. TaxID=37632 RepID=UPI00260401DC|nr:hypothetical protein [Amycolatopsis sp.]MCU1686652.1 hypothetical protein [Amycolatopsis sp.]
MFQVKLGEWWRRSAVRIAVLAVLVVGFAAALVWRVQSPADAGKPYQVPQDRQLESSLGIRISQAAVVADGGLVEIRYTVLDGQKASKFQNDVHHPPLLHSERRNGDVYRAALMKQGHELRPGQTYYILYLNNANAIRSGETLEIDAGGARLQHVPVR